MAHKLNDYPSVSLKPEEYNGGIDFARIFGRTGRVHIEIGSGKGTFLVNQAKSEPEVNFLGIERASRYYRYSVDRIGRWALKNVRILRTDAADFIRNNIPERAVDCFHIYFPDPWPKRKHHKRRFFKPASFEELLRTLKTDGEIKVATDHREYFKAITEIIENNTARVRQIPFQPTSSAGIGEWVGTNFERKYLKENRPIYTIAARKAQ